MKINTFKSIATLIAICFLLFGIISSGDALTITSMSGDSEEYDWGWGAYHSATVTTDTPYYVVEWYINNVYQGCTPGGYEGDENGPTTATFYFSDLSGDIEGTRHTIKAVAWDQEDHSDSASDTDSYEITVYKPKYTSTPIHNRKLLFVHGYVEISKQTYDYDSGYMSFDYSTYADHNGPKADGTVSVETEYKASFPDLNLENKDWRPNAGQLKPTDSWDTRVFSDSGSHGITLEFGREGRYYDGEAYVRLVVDGKDGIDNYRITNLISCLHR